MAAEKTEYYVSPKQFKEELATYYKTDIITDSLAIHLSKIAHGLSYHRSFINYCVDEETEALTKRGWLKWDEIDINDIIISYDISKHCIVESPIKELFINKEYVGKMFWLTNDRIDSLVTRGHKFVTQNGLKAVEFLRQEDVLIINEDEYLKCSEINFHNALNNSEIYLSNTPTVDYEGVVWCPVTEYGTFVCRRNGKIVITGNTNKDDMVGDALIKMYAALKNKKYSFERASNPFSYFNAIAWNAFINRIKKEKRQRKAEYDYRQKVYEETMSDPNISMTNIYIKPNSSDPYDSSDD